MISGLFSSAAQQARLGVWGGRRHDDLNRRGASNPTNRSPAEEPSTTVRQPTPATKRVPADRAPVRRIALILLGSGLISPLLIALSGCGAAAGTAYSSNAAFSISPATTSVDASCTGCNATDARGVAAHQLNARLAAGGSAAVTWSVSGGDAVAGAGAINATGQYTPPSYLTTGRTTVVVTARLA